MNEIFPILSGLIVGVVLGAFGSRVRLLVGSVAAVAVGALATILSGEHAISWGFLLFDIPLVGLCSVLGYLASRAVRLSIGGERARPE